MTGEELLLLRRRKRITQVELGKRIGLSDAMISYWERGRFPIPTERVEQIRKALEHPVPKPPTPYSVEK